MFKTKKDLVKLLEIRKNMPSFFKKLLFFIKIELQSPKTTNIDYVLENFDTIYIKTKYITLKLESYVMLFGSL